MKKISGKAVEALRRLGEPTDPLSPQELLAIKQNILQAVAVGAGADPVEAFWPDRSGKILRYLVPAALGFLVLGGTALAAGAARPGDILYPVKLVKEQIQVNLTPTPEDKVTMQAGFAQERMDELKELSVKNQVARQISGNGLASSTTVQNDIDTDKNQENLESQVRQRAELEVNSAMVALKQEQDHCKTEGEMGMAEKMSQNMKSLRAQAQAQNLQIKMGPNQQNRG